MIDLAREESIEATIIEAQLDARDDREPVKIMACAGWPRCELQDGRALNAMSRHCPWCSVILVQPDGTYSRSDPPVA